MSAEKSGLPNLADLRNDDPQFYRRLVWMDMNFYRRLDDELAALAETRARIKKPKEEEA